ncbi:MAG: DUF2723 domain-containing protein, partial [Gemmatimonadota bacterium]
SEYIATAHIVGLPHPPGNPFFVALGKAWLVLTAWLPMEVAPRINLLAATASAAAAAFWFLAVMRIWDHFTEDRRISLAAGFIAVLIGGTAFTVWTQSNVNEKVYTVSLMFVALLTYLAMVWEDHSESWRGDRIFLLVCFLLGLGATNHQMSILPLLALGVFLVIHSFRTLLRWRLLSAAVLLGIVGFSFQLLFVPIRSAQDPIIDEADPECENLIDAVTPGFYESYDDRRLLVECDALAASLAREQYQKPPLSERQAPFGAQFANYFQYFDWQWARSLPPEGRLLVTFLFIGLGLVGLWRHWRGDPDSFYYFATLLFTVTVILVYYLNFRYGYSLSPDIPMDRHEVRERDYFFIVSFNLWGLYAGMGLVTLWEGLGRRLSSSPETKPGTGLRNASPLLGIALIPLLFNYSFAQRDGDYAARDWAYNLLNSVEPYSVLFTNGDNDTFPLWYLQEVEGIRRDVTVVVHSYLGTKWYPKQLRELTDPCEEGEDPLESPTIVACQRPFEPDRAPDVYDGMGETPPARSILDISDEQVDALPPAQEVPEGQRVRFSENVSVELGTARVLYHPDFLVYRIIRNSLGDRPVYFAATAPPVYERWDLQSRLLRQALAYKLVNGPIETTDDVVRLDGVPVPWIDRERSDELLWNVFQVDYLLDDELWLEPSTRSSIPAQYYYAYMTLSLAHEQREAPEKAEAAAARARQFFELAQQVIP